MLIIARKVKILENFQDSYYSSLPKTDDYHNMGKYELFLLLPGISKASGRHLEGIWKASERLKCLSDTGDKA
jgi:hypothetical protein